MAYAGSSDSDMSSASTAGSEPYASGAERPRAKIGDSTKG